ncbi:MAG: AMP-binding protein [Acidimicrobiales bacterium]
MLLGLRPADAPFHVGVLLDNVPDFVFLLFGAALAGATIVGINPTRRGAELARDILHTDCQAIVTDPERVPMVTELELGPVGDRVLVSPGIAYDRSPALPDGRPSPEDLYLLLFTSGSTGAPKAVRMSHGRAARQASESARAFTSDDILYCAMPLFHGNALIANLFPALVAGASVVLRRRFSASGFTADIRAHRCTYFNYVGRALAYIVAVPEHPHDRANQLKWALGSEASPLTIAEFTRRFGCPIFEGYGSSENAVIIQPAPGMPAGALGRPKKGTDVAIVGADGRECASALLDESGRLLNPEAAIGEIVGRNTAGLFEGYYRNPEADAERTRDGWYWSGDLGYRDEAGWVYFAGRTADWLRVDGENFSAGAVERILNRYAESTGVAVYGVPDPVTGDQVMVAIEGPATLDIAGFATFLDAQPDLGTKWAPRFVRVVPALPVTATRKVDKVILRAQGWEAPGSVFWRPDVNGSFRLMTDADRDALRRQFAQNGRLDLMSRPALGRE